ncbi:MAG: hypothetical protein JXR19_08545 [Bacteroidia bacterium]
MSQKFEDILKKRFEHFEADVDSVMFDKIVEKRKRRTAIIWWKWASWTAAFIALIVVSKLAYDYQSDRNEIVEPPLVEGQNNEFNSSSENNSDDNTVISNQAEESQMTAEDLQSEQPIENQNIGSNPNHIVYDAPLAHEPIENPVVQDEPVVDAPVVDNPLEGDPLEAPVADEPDQSVALDDDDQGDDDGQEVEVVDAEPIVDTNKPEDFIDNAESSPDGQQKVKSTKFIPSGWSFEITGGPGHAYRSLSGNPELTRWRNETESPAMSYQANVTGVRALNNNWFFRAGLTVTQRNENFNFLQQNSMNRYTGIAIPVEMEKAFYIKKKWSISGRLGLMLRLHEFKNGYIRTSETAFEPISDAVVERSGYLATNFGMGVNYRVNQRFQLLLQPQWSHSTSSNFSDQNNLAHRDYGFFTRFGIRVDL